MNLCNALSQGEGCSGRSDAAGDLSEMVQNDSNASTVIFNRKWVPFTENGMKDNSTKMLLTLWWSYPSLGTANSLVMTAAVFQCSCQKQPTECFCLPVIYESCIYLNVFSLSVVLLSGFLDPEKKLFSHRILSRDECIDPYSKTGNLR